MLTTQVVTGLAEGGAYALMAVAIVLVFSGTRVLSLAIGEMGAFGLLLGLKWDRTGVPLVHWHPSANLAGPFAMLLAIVCGAILGVVVERFIMRPVEDRSPASKLVVTLGIALFLALAEYQFISTNPQPMGSPLGASGTGQLHLFGSVVTWDDVASLGLAIVMAGSMALFLQKTRFGLAVRATTSNPGVSRLLGIRVARVHRFTWVVGAALSALAAAFLSSTSGEIYPLSMTAALLYAMAGAVIGGLDSLGGAVSGSLLVGILQGVLAPRFGPTAAIGATLGLVMLVLLARPRGMFGTVDAS